MPRHASWSTCVGTIPPAWDIGVLAGPVAVDEIHPREEVVWDYLEKTTHLNEDGHATAVETRGTVRAVVDGVTGFTIHHVNNTGTKPVGLGIYKGGKPGRKHPLGPLHTYRLNIDFLRRLRLNRTLQLHWYLDLEPRPDVRVVHSMAEAIQIPTRNLTLRAQFTDPCLPVAPRVLRRRAGHPARPRLIPNARCAYSPATSSLTLGRGSK